MLVSKKNNNHHFKFRIFFIFCAFLILFLSSILTLSACGSKSTSDEDTGYHIGGINADEEIGIPQTITKELYVGVLRHDIIADANLPSNWKVTWTISDSDDSSLEYDRTVVKLEGNKITIATNSFSVSQYFKVECLIIPAKGKTINLEKEVAVTTKRAFGSLYIQLVGSGNTPAGATTNIKLIKDYVANTGKFTIKTIANNATNQPTSSQYSFDENSFVATGPQSTNSCRDYFRIDNENSVMKLIVRPGLGKGSYRFKIFSTSARTGYQTTTIEQEITLSVLELFTTNYDIAPVFVETQYQNTTDAAPFVLPYNYSSFNVAVQLTGTIPNRDLNTYNWGAITIKKNNLIINTTLIYFDTTTSGYSRRIKIDAGLGAATNAGSGLYSITIKSRISNSSLFYDDYETPEATAYFYVNNQISSTTKLIMHEGTNLTPITSITRDVGYTTLYYSVGIYNAPLNNNPLISNPSITFTNVITGSDSTFDLNYCNNNIGSIIVISTISSTAATIYFLTPGLPDGIYQFRFSFQLSADHYDTGIIQSDLITFEVRPIVNDSGITFNGQLDIVVGAEPPLPSQPLTIHNYIPEGYNTTQILQPFKLLATGGGPISGLTSTTWTITYDSTNPLNNKVIFPISNPTIGTSANEFCPTINLVAGLSPLNDGRDPYHFTISVDATVPGSTFSPPPPRDVYIYIKKQFNSFNITSKQSYIPNQYSPSLTPAANGNSFQTINKNEFNNLSYKDTYYGTFTEDGNDVFNVPNAQVTYMWDLVNVTKNGSPITNFSDCFTIVKPNATIQKEIQIRLFNAISAGTYVFDIKLTKMYDGYVEKSNTFKLAAKVLQLFTYNRNDLVVNNTNVSIINQSLDDINNQIVNSKGDTTAECTYDFFIPALPSGVTSQLSISTTSITQSSKITINNTGSVPTLTINVDPNPIGNYFISFDFRLSAPDSYVSLTINFSLSVVIKSELPYDDTSIIATDYADFPVISEDFHTISAQAGFFINLTLEQNIPTPVAIPNGSYVWSVSCIAGGLASSMFSITSSATNSSATFALQANIPITPTSPYILEITCAISGTNYNPKIVTQQVSVYSYSEIIVDENEIIPNWNDALVSPLSSPLTYDLTIAPSATGTSLTNATLLNYQLDFTYDEHGSGVSNITIDDNRSLTDPKNSNQELIINPAISNGFYRFDLFLQIEIPGFLPYFGIKTFELNVQGNFPTTVDLVKDDQTVYSDFILNNNYDTYSEHLNIAFPNRPFSLSINWNLDLTAIPNVDNRSKFALNPNGTFTIAPGLPVGLYTVRFNFQLQATNYYDHDYQKVINIEIGEWKVEYNLDPAILDNVNDQLVITAKTGSADDTGAVYEYCDENGSTTYDAVVFVPNLVTPNINSEVVMNTHWSDNLSDTACYFYYSTSNSDNSPFPGSSTFIFWDTNPANQSAYASYWTGGAPNDSYSNIESAAYDPVYDAFVKQTQADGDHIQIVQRPYVPGYNSKITLTQPADGTCIIDYSHAKTPEFTIYLKVTFSSGYVLYLSDIIVASNTKIDLGGGSTVFDFDAITNDLIGVSATYNPDTDGTSVDFQEAIDNNLIPSFTKIGDWAFCTQQQGTFTDPTFDPVNHSPDNPDSTEASATNYDIAIPYLFDDVIFPDTLTEIGTGAFFKNKFTISDFKNVTTIGDMAFYSGYLSQYGTISAANNINYNEYQITIESFDFMNTAIINIGSYAFVATSTLNVENINAGLSFSCELTFNDLTTNIGDYAFSNTYISDIKIQSFSSLNMGTHVFESLYLETNITVSQYDINFIPDYTFMGTNVINFDLQDIETIGEGAFCASGITSVLTGDFLQSIGTKAFAYCQQLDNIAFSDVPDPFNPSASVPITIGAWAFAYCPNVTDISFPEGGSVKDIPDYCFFGTAVRAVNFYNANNDAVYDGGNSDIIFSSTSTPITLKLDGVKTIGQHAFDCAIDTLDPNASSMIYFPENPTVPLRAKFISNITVVDIEQVEEIKEYAFANNSSLTRFFYGYNDISLTIEKNDISSLKYIRDYAFYNCNNLGGNTNAGSLTFNSSSTSFTTIGDYAFYNTSIVVINFGRIVTIGDYAFSKTKLTTINFGTSQVTTIGDYAFSYITPNLNATTQLVFSTNNTIALGEYAFAYDRINWIQWGIQSVISDYCFYHNTTLVKVVGTTPGVVGDNDFSTTFVTEFGKHAFDSCNITGAIIFHNATGAGAVPIAVPITIKDYAFAYNTNITEVDFRSSVQNLGTGILFCQGTTSQIVSLIFGYDSSDPAPAWYDPTDSSKDISIFDGLNSTAGVYREVVNTGSRVIYLTELQLHYGLPATGWQ